TGAREALEGYCEALVRQDWAQAYAVLASESQQRCGAAEFTRRAAAYQRGLGFKPEWVRVRSCQEHGNEALAQVIFSGRAVSGRRASKDAVVLRREDGRWGVLLPDNFGSPTR